MPSADPTLAGNGCYAQAEETDGLDARQTSAAVEGPNPKARVILKRPYGVKATDNLWTWLILDVNWATDVVRYITGQIRKLVVGSRAAFARI